MNLTQVLLGSVLDTTGSGAVCLVDRAVLRSSRSDGSPDHLAATSIGGFIKISTGEMLLFATITQLDLDRSDPARAVLSVEYVGEGFADQHGNVTQFRRGLSHYPHPGDEVRFASTEDLREIFAPPEVPHIQIGTVYPTSDVRAPILFDMLMGRHFAVVGSSGAGKSTMVALMLDRVISYAPNGHVVILDPHGEYARAFGDRAQVWDVGNLQLPYWAMNLEEHCEAFITSTGDSRMVDANILARCLLKARARNINVPDVSRLTPDSPISYQIKDLYEVIDEEAGKLEKAAESHRYIQLKLNIQQYFSDPRFRFIFNPTYAGHSLEDCLGELLRIPGNGKPMSIIDLAGVPSEIINVVVSTLCRMTLDYAIWAPREGRVPVLLVCEEAHRYLPRVKSTVTRSVERQLERIAREGRKYGVCFGMITQRPSELSETALAQCGTIISLRLNNQSDQFCLTASLSEGARGLVGVISTLKNRECIVSGDGVPIPMRVMIDTLEEHKRPLSDDPHFSAAWQRQNDGHGLMHETVRRWRDET